MDQNFRVFCLDPFFKCAKVKLYCFLFLFKPIVIMNENFISMFFLKDSINDMTTEKLHFQSASEAKIFCNWFMGLGKCVTDNDSIDLFELMKLFCMRFKVICKLVNWDLFVIASQNLWIFTVLAGYFIINFTWIFTITNFFFNNGHCKLINIISKRNFFKIGKEFDRSYFI